MEDKKKTGFVSEEKQVCSVHVEPLIKNIYTMKALQSSNQPDTLTWDSVGDQVTYNADGAITMQEWKRQCIFLCSSGDFGDKPGYFLTDYDGYYDLPSYGNKLFKAVMCKLVYDLALPPFTSAEVGVQVYLTYSKFTDNSSSSTWVGGITMDWDHCKTIGKNNNEHDKWSGVPSSAVYFSSEYNMPAVNAHCLNIFDSKHTADNTSDIMQHHLLAPIYLMSMVERPKSYNTLLGVGDTIPNEEKIIVTPQFTSLISYNDNEVQKYTYSDRRTKGISLKKPERIGYVMKGWLDGATGRLYPAGGYYAEKRGINLTEQWIEDVVPYKVVHHYAKKDGTYSEGTEKLYYLVGGTVCPQPNLDQGYETPEPITASVAADGSTVIDYYYEFKECPVQYLANGGNFGSDGAFKEIKVPYGMKIEPLGEKPERTGYEFVEWDPYPEYADSSYTIVTKAVWDAHKYTVQYDKGDDNATGNMKPQRFVYDQPQQLSKNTYECSHAIKYEVVTPKKEKICFEQTVKCGFVGWTIGENGAKVYSDEELVCNLTTEDGGQVQLEALWEPASIRLPQFDYEGYYLDAWYESDDYQGTPIKPGSEYKPKEGVTLYGKLICTKAKNPRWEQGEEPVEERTIKAVWEHVEGATAYRVGLENEAKRVNYPLYAEDFTGDNVTYINPGAVEVIGTELDFTETFKRFTAGGTFNFSVEPAFDNIPPENIERTVSPAITTLARPDEKDLRWDGTRAVWKKVEGATYYLLEVVDERDVNIVEGGFEYNESYGLPMYDEDTVQVDISGQDEEGIELSEVIIDYSRTVKFKLLAYNDACYTPQYLWPESDFFVI